MPISKPFVIATEGATIDGRNISRQWLTDMAKNYSQKVYTAVANLEHYLSSLPDGIFKAYGKVVSLATRETEILGEKKLQLLAVVDASQEIVDLQKKGQKAFSSMEVGQIGSGTFYLTGLAFTDTPASIGTESMKFSMAGMSGERYAFKDEIEIEFEGEEKPSAGDTLFAKIKDLLGVGKKDADARFADQANAIEVIAESQKPLLEGFARIEKEMAEIGASVKLNADAIAARQEEFAAFKAKVETTPDAAKQRPPATGGNGRVTTDC